MNKAKMKKKKAVKQTVNQEEIPTILLLVPSLESGSIERAVMDLAIYIKMVGWNVIVASSGGALVRILKRYDIEHVLAPLHSKNFFDIRNSQRIIKSIIKKHNVTVVHAHSVLPSKVAYKVCNDGNVPLVNTVYKVYNKGFINIKRSAYKVLAKGDAVIAVSDFVKNFIKDEYDIPEEKLVVVSKWVDLEQFDPTAVSAERIVNVATKWRIPEDHKIISVFANLNVENGHRILLEALKKVKDSSSEKIRCLLLSAHEDKRYRAAIERMIKKLGLTDTVHLIDQPLDDIPATLMLTDVVISPSLIPEAFGLIHLEAQAMGKIVIATAHGGALENIKDGKTGKLVKAGHIDEMSNAIKWAITLESEERHKISVKAMSYVRDNFSKEGQCRKILEVYASFF
jgi:glycosyltransferase involved in cell wall biosynthesis